MWTQICIKYDSNIISTTSKNNEKYSFPKK